MNDTQNNAPEDKGPDQSGPIEKPNEAGPADTGPQTLDSVALLASLPQAGDGAAPYGVKADGTPRAKPGRKPGQKSAANVSAAAPGPAVPVTTPAAPRARSKAELKAQQVSSAEIARMVFASFAIGMVNLVGEEWAPQSQEEADGMRATIAAYIEAKADGKMSPEAMLGVAVLGYSMARLGHENTRSKFGVFFGKLGGAIKTVYKRFFGG